MSRMTENREASSGSEANDHSLVTEIFDELSSAGFLEQLRLECVADVKTKSTYLQLKQRFVELLNKKISNPDWKSQTTAPRLNIFREQVVECGVLAVTIERVVDEVVSWKIREYTSQLIKEIICSCLGNKKADKLTFDGTSPENQTDVQREEIIKKICESIHVDWKHVFKDGHAIGNSLATVSFSTSISQQSDDEFLSASSTVSTDVELSSDEAGKKSRTSIKKKKSGNDTMDKKPVRSRRERKINSKYSSDIYLSSINIQKPEPRKSSTPIPVSPIKEKTSAIANGQVLPQKKKPLSAVIVPVLSGEKNLLTTANGTASRVKKKLLSQTNGPALLEKCKPLIPVTCDDMRKDVNRNEEDKKFVESIKIIRQKPSNEKNGVQNVFKLEIKDPPKRERSPELVFARKSEPVLKAMKVTHKPKNNDENVSLRKSVRRPKPNSLIFWEPGKLKSKGRDTEPELLDLKQMKESALSKPMPPKNGQISKISSHKEIVSKKRPSFETSSQRYASADLYKPRPIISSKVKRSHHKKKCLK